ncbi:MAG: metallophosphoesterase [Armatimonadota bacterium]|nr:MAG: metallophosphoesterase [Armatimonadota bacterium]
MHLHFSRRLVFVSLLLAALTSLGASARNLDGTLAMIVRPISTLPTIVQAGDAFEVTIVAGQPVEEMRVALYRGPDDTIVFTHSRQEPPLQPQDGSITVEAVVPQDMAPGLYDMLVTTRPDRRRDTAERAVKVVAQWPQSYVFAHVTDVHIGREDPPLRDQVFKRTIAEINPMGVDFVLISGDDTDRATPEQYRDLLQPLDGCEVPTFLSPGNHDRAEGEQPGAAGNIYERYCGPGNYAFDFGSHRYLCLDTSWGWEYLNLPANRTWLEQQLERPKPSMGVAFSHRFSDKEFPYFQEQLPANNYRLCVYGHTHDDGMQWIGPKRLMLLNTSEELMGTYNIVTISGDQVFAIDHVQRKCAD